MYWRTFIKPIAFICKLKKKQSERRRAEKKKCLSHYNLLCAKARRLFDRFTFVTSITLQQRITEATTTYYGQNMYNDNFRYERQ